MKKKVSSITDVLALTVFAVFAVCVLVVVLYGARSYQSLVRRSEESFASRTAAQYVATRVRQAERVTVTDFEGCDALTITEEIDGAPYLTRVYCCDGYLRELFSAETALLSPQDGEKVMPAESMQLALDRGILIATVDGRQIILQLQGKEVSP